MGVRRRGDYQMGRTFHIAAMAVFLSTSFWISGASAADRPVALVESIEGAPSAGVGFLCLTSALMGQIEEFA
jgi:hypothetical protein